MHHEIHQQPRDVLYHLHCGSSPFNIWVYEAIVGNVGNQWVGLLYGNIGLCWITCIWFLHQCGNVPWFVRYSFHIHIIFSLSINRKITKSKYVLIKYNVFEDFILNILSWDTYIHTHLGDEVEYLVLKPFVDSRKMAGNEGEMGNDMHYATTNRVAIHSWRLGHQDVLRQDKFGKIIEHSRLFDSDSCCSIEVGIVTKFRLIIVVLRGAFSTQSVNASKGLHEAA